MEGISLTAFLVNGRPHSTQALPGKITGKLLRLTILHFFLFCFLIWISNAFMVIKCFNYKGTCKKPPSNLSAQSYKHMTSTSVPCPATNNYRYKFPIYSFKDFVHKKVNAFLQSCIQFLACLWLFSTSTFLHFHTYAQFYHLSAHRR